MVINKIIDLNDGTKAELEEDFTIDGNFYRVLICSDVYREYINEDIFTIPAYLVIIPIPEMYNMGKRNNLVLGEIVNE